MKDHRTCPICGKKDIPDFSKKGVECPCCGADLTIYHRIESAKKKLSATIKWVMMACFVGILCIVVITIKQSQIGDMKSKISSQQQKIKSLENERDSLRWNLDNYYQGPSSENDMYGEYIVKKGDSFCRISKILYGTEARSGEIIVLNGLDITTVIQPGDTLRVRTNGTNIVD